MDECRYCGKPFHRLDEEGLELHEVSCVPLDPNPYHLYDPAGFWEDRATYEQVRYLEGYVFNPRDGFSQNEEDYHA